VTRVVIGPGRQQPTAAWPVEVVERKGLGHPDTLADGVAEAISRAYSRYTLEHFGEVAHHWVDKCMLIGGESQIGFGSGRLIKPMTLIVVGKASERIGERAIPVRDIAGEAARAFFAERLPLLDVATGLRIEYRLNSAVGAGRPARWYRPGSSADLTPLTAARSNDAVICTAYAPLSLLEEAVLGIERHLNGPAFKASRPEIGSDIKVLGTRVGPDVDIVTCLPFIANATPTARFYADGKDSAAAEIRELAERHLPGHRVSVRVNTRDDEEAVYLTVTGTAADTGDIGVVGRGNRINGLISPGRCTSIEAPAGKNPSYHGGKIYAVLALDLADAIAAHTGQECDVTITTSTGNLLSEPDLVAVELATGPGWDGGMPDKVRSEVGELVAAALNGVETLSQSLVECERELW
jgi:S-adenosylmethionine synthetase